MKVYSIKTITTIFITLLVIFLTFLFMLTFVDMLFIQMCSKPENEEEEVYFAGEDDKRLITAATQTLDLLALHLPPEKLVLHLVSKFLFLY